MDKMKKKLRSKKGESLIESLVSILIFTLASIMLYTMLSTSVRLNQAAKDADAKYEVEMIYAEQGEKAYPELPAGANGDGNVNIELVKDGGNKQTLVRYNVEIHRQDKDSLYSYSKK